MRLTADPGDDVNPVWSPDGRTIAFYRSSPGGDGIFLVPALGGAERKLAGVWANRFGFGSHTWIHWSPDGKWLAVSDKTSADEPFSLFLLSPETREKRRVTSPPTSVVGDCSPAFSPDGKRLAFVRVVSAVVGEVYLVSLDGGETRRLTFEGASAIWRGLRTGASSSLRPGTAAEAVYSGSRLKAARLNGWPLLVATLNTRPSPTRGPGWPGGKTRVTRTYSGWRSNVVRGRSNLSPI